MTPRRVGQVFALAVALPGCSGVQSALSPSGREALDIDPLFWTVTAIAAAVTLLVTVLVGLAIYGPRSWRERLSGDWIIVGGGIVFPVVVLTLLLVYGFVVMQAGATRAALAEGPGTTIVGKRWWWKVVYETPDGREIVSANELRIPVGRATPLRLITTDVIHSFWAPRLAGKLDMIPGRTNVLTVEPTEAGISRGQCAEYCGGAHALMSFFVIAMPAEEYDAWLEAEAQPAREPRDESLAAGLDLFLSNGCGACHTIRGTPAAGVVGPDLTHLGSRHSLAAATLPNNAEAIANWIADNQHIKPANLMPEYDYLGADELASISSYLASLE
ncbi:cytochrome c oxidase subunit II [Microbaculum marinum]|uniref:C-type cytochrome n=1 Tax=Microbaculum marinum TaxID=1764581 RepID=A0AAW9RNC0_9HYPH